MLNSPQLPMFNPFRKGGGQRPAPPAGPGSKELSRLYAMAVVFLLCVGAMIYMKRQLGTDPGKKDALPADQIRYSVQDGDSRTPPLAAQEDASRPRKEIPLPPRPKDAPVDFKALAAPFRDGQEKPVKETPEFVALLDAALNGVTPEDFSKKVAPGLTCDAVYREPAKHRGDVLRVYGRLIYIYTERMESTTPNNIEYVYLAVLQEYPKNRTVYAYLPEKPKDPKTGQPIAFRTHVWKGQTIYDDWVELEGAFLRTYDYPGQRALPDMTEDPLIRSVVLFGKNLRIVEKPRMKHTREGFIVVISVLAAVVVAVVLVAGIMSRKYGDASLRMKMFALKRDKAKAEGKGVFAAAPAPAPTSTPPADPEPPPDAPKS
jgi:hypothetical protein